MPSNPLTIALYHHIGDPSSPLLDGLSVSTPPTLFAEHLDHFERDYDIVDLDRVLDGELPPRPLLLTFDDGYGSVADVAAPLLARRGLPSVLFASEAFLGGGLPLDNVLCWLSHHRDTGEVGAAIGPGPRCATVADLVDRVAEQPYARRLALRDELCERFGVDAQALTEEARGLLLDRAALRELPRTGMAIGNHTRSHVHCRAIVEPDQAEHELTDHRAELERWSESPVRTFSYPYGRSDDASGSVERALAAGGHEATFLVCARDNRWRAGGPWFRVSLQDQPVRRLNAHLHWLPLVRAVRARLRGR